MVNCVVDHASYLSYKVSTMSRKVLTSVFTYIGVAKVVLKCSFYSYICFNNSVCVLFYI